MSWRQIPLGYCVAEVRMKNVGGREDNLLSLSYGNIIRRDIAAADGLLPESFDSYNVVFPGDTVLRLTDLQNDQRSLRVGLVGEVGIITSAYVTVRPSKVVHPKFLNYFLKHMDFRKDFYALGAGVRQSLKFDELRSVKVPVPSFADQKAISDYLDHETYRIEALIEKYRGLESLLELRDLSMVYKSIFGEESTLESIDRRAYSMQLRRVVLQTNAGEVIDKSWWGAGNERLYTCAREVLDSNYENFPDWKRTQRSDLLITRNGTPYIHIPLENSIYSNVVQRINIGNQYSREYIAFALEAVVGGMKAQGVSIDSFNYDMWKSLVIPIPEIEIQREISNDIVKSKIQLGVVRELVQTQISLLNEQRQALITAAVTGELEIPEVAA